MNRCAFILFCWACVQAFAVGLALAEEDPTIEKARRESLRRDWKIVSGSLEGPEYRAVQLVNAELGRFLVRDAGVYAIHTLPVVRAGDSRPIPGRNEVIIGTPENNPRLAGYVARSEIPANGYCVRAFEGENGKVIAIAGDTPEAVLYGAVDFVEDGLPALAARLGNGIVMPDYTFDGRAFRTRYESRRAPRTRIRSVFTWGHVISDYQEYFRNLARLKLNEVILWNDYEPLNAREIVACAHSWGIKVIWGFAWGWTTGQCREAKLDDESLKRLENDIVSAWRDTWGRLPGDGIYFQSFTETRADNHGGRTIASAVVRLVNATSARIWAERPDQRIIFGLHVTSVRDHLDEIDRTDPRMEIYWEDFGGFPFDVRGGRVLSSADEALASRLSAGERPVGLVYKCQLFQDWKNFFHQNGPYLLGEAGPRVMSHDVAVTTDPWRGYTNLWLEHGERAHAVTQALQRAGKTPALCLAGNFNGPLYYPAALAAELFWSADEPYETIRARVLGRMNVMR